MGWNPKHPAPDSEDIVSCVACGLCLPPLPHFSLDRPRDRIGHAGEVAAMRAVDEDEAQIDDGFATMMDECLACRACETACPQRRALRSHDGSSPRPGPSRPDRPLTRARSSTSRWSNYLGRQWLVRLAGRGLALAQAIGLDRLLPSSLTAGAPRVSLRELSRPLPESVGHGPESALMTGCVMEVAFRDVQPRDDGSDRGDRPPRGSCRPTAAAAEHWPLTTDSQRPLGRSPGSASPSLKASSRSWSTAQAAVPT